MAKKAVIAGGLASLALLIMSCSNSTAPSGPGVVSQVSGNPITFSLISGDSTGDTIVEITQQPNSCNGSTLVQGTQDTAKELYKFTGDSMLATSASLTTAYFFGGGLRNTTVWYVFTGGSHSGLSFSGTWHIVGVLGEPSSALTDSVISARLPEILNREITAGVTGNQIQISSTITFADDFIASWKSLDSSTYSMTVTKVAQNMVTVTGDTTHYTATIWEDAAGNTNFTNTYSEYGPYSCLANPSVCPNSPNPVWWNQFLNQNKR